MLEAAAGVSVPLIAILFVLQLVLPHLAKRKAAKVAADPTAIKEAAILGHQVTQIDQRTQSIDNRLGELIAVTKDSAEASRANTRAIEKLTDKIER
jgi:hypothetical protein